MNTAILYEQLQTDEAGQIDITPLLGTWVNSNQATEWIKEFTLARKGSSFTIHAYGVREPFDWGEIEITTYMDNIGEMAFCAVYDLESTHSVLAANTNKELIVIAAFHRFKDDNGRSNFLCREFYIRED